MPPKLSKQKQKRKTKITTEQDIYGPVGRPHRLSQIQPSSSSEEDIPNPHELQQRVRIIEQPTGKSYRKENLYGRTQEFGASPEKGYQVGMMHEHNPLKDYKMIRDNYLNILARNPKITYEGYTFIEQSLTPADNLARTDPELATVYLHETISNLLNSLRNLGQIPTQSSSTQSSSTQPINIPRLTLPSSEFRTPLGSPLGTPSSTSSRRFDIFESRPASEYEEIEEFTTPREHSFIGTESKDLYDVLTNKIKSSLINVSDLDRVNLTNALAIGNDISRYNYDKANEYLTNILSAITLSNKQPKKSKFNEEYKRRLKDIEDEKSIEETGKDIDEAYLNNEITKEEHDAIKKVIHDKKRIKALYKHKRKILTPKLRQQIEQDTDTDINKLLNQRKTSDFPLYNKIPTKYIYNPFK